MKRVEELGISPMPWKSENKYRGYTDTLFFEVIDSSEYPVFAVSEIAGAYTLRSNATLMAAAPELYEALRKLVELHDACADGCVNCAKRGRCDVEEEAALEDARNALAKAGGAE